MLDRTSRYSSLTQKLQFLCYSDRVDHQNIEYKAAWNEAFAAYLHDLNVTKPVIWMGDVNCAPTPQGFFSFSILLIFQFHYFPPFPFLLDLANHKTNWNKTPGHTQIETEGFTKIVDISSQTTPDADTTGNAPDKLVDIWRHLHPDLQHYTYFSYKFRCREKTLGWRLDMCK